MLLLNHVKFPRALLNAAKHGGFFVLFARKLFAVQIVKTDIGRGRVVCVTREFFIPLEDDQNALVVDDVFALRCAVPAGAHLIEVCSVGRGGDNGEGLDGILEGDGLGEEVVRDVVGVNLAERRTEDASIVFKNCGSGEICPAARSGKAGDQNARQRV